MKGWDGGEAWINTSTLLARINFANQLSNSRGLLGGGTPRLADYLRQNSLTPDGWVDHLMETLGPLPLTPSTRQTLREFVNQGDASAGGLEGRLRAVIPLLMATPEYQVC